MAIVPQNGMKQHLHNALMLGHPNLLLNMADKHSVPKEIMIQIAVIIKDNLLIGNRITSLQAAVLVGNYRICKQLLYEGVLTVTFCKLSPPLFIALNYERYQIARLLIESGANVFLELDGLTPMFFALTPNTPEYIIEAIIKAGFPVDHIIENKNKSTAMHKAVHLRNLKVIKLLLKYKADCNVKEECMGCTPMHFAVTEKFQDIIQVLFDNSADIEAETKEGLTPLFIAIGLNDVGTMNFLIELGANIHHLSSTMLIYPLHFAANRGRKAIVEALLMKGADPLMEAPGTASLPIHSVALSDRGKRSQNCAKELNDITELLINYGSEVNSPDKFGLTPMKYALKVSNFNIVRTLIKKGASLKNDLLDQSTHLHYAAKFGSKEVISLFLEYGADYFAKDESGKTPYQIAILNANYEVLSMFWGFGYPFEMPDKIPNRNLPFPPETWRQLDNQRLFFKGIKKNKADMVLRALLNGAEARACSKDMPFPLHFAVSKNFSSVVLLLLENGVPVNTVDQNDECPLHIAARQGNIQICCYLLSYGACYNVRTKSTRKTPLVLASENNHSVLACMLKDLSLMFNTTLKNKSEGLIRKFDKSNNVHYLQAYINSVNRAGDSLMAVALKKGNVVFAEHLMKLRVQIIKT